MRTTDNRVIDICERLGLEAGEHWRFSRNDDGEVKIIIRTDRIGAVLAFAGEHCPELGMTVRLRAIA